MTNYAMIVGYSNYGEGLTPLPGVVSTADTLKALLEYSEKGASVFDEVMEPMIDEVPDDVEKKLDQLFEKIGHDDRIALILIGHGKVWEEQTPQLKLASHRAKANRFYPAEWLNVASLVAKLDGTRAKEKLLLLDCCSANFLSLESSGKSAAADLDVGDRSNSFALQIKSEAVNLALAAPNGGVARITSAASDKSAWIGPLPENTKYPKLIKRALKESKYLKEEPDQTFFCQAVAICHWIASNVDELRESGDTLTSDEHHLVAKIAETLQPDLHGRLWASRITKAAAHLLKTLGTDQTPHFEQPSDTHPSQIALLRIAGPSLLQLLADLQVRMDKYDKISPDTREKINRTIQLSSDARQKSPKQIALARKLLSFPVGKEYLVVEEILNVGRTEEISAETSAMKRIIAENFEATFAAQQNEYKALNEKYESTTSDMREEQKKLNGKYEELEKKYGELEKKYEKYKNESSIGLLKITKRLDKSRYLNAVLLGILLMCVFYIATSL